MLLFLFTLADSPPILSSPLQNTSSTNPEESNSKINCLIFWVAVAWSLSAFSYKSEWISCPSTKALNRAVTPAPLPRCLIANSPSPPRTTNSWKSWSGRKTASEADEESMMSHHLKHLMPRRGIPKCCDSSERRNSSRAPSPWIPFFPLVLLQIGLGQRVEPFYPKVFARAPPLSNHQTKCWRHHE